MKRKYQTKHQVPFHSLPILDSQRSKDCRIYSIAGVVNTICAVLAISTNFPEVLDN